jgi:hypothetical protein
MNGPIQVEGGTLKLLGRSFICHLVNIKSVWPRLEAMTLWPVK